MSEKIRYHPHVGGINQAIGPIHELTPVELLTMIQESERAYSSKKLTKYDIGFDLIYVASERTGDESPAFLRFVHVSGFKEIYSVMVEHTMTVGYTDRPGW